MKEQEKKEEDIIELRSEEFQEVLSGIPHGYYAGVLPLLLSSSLFY